MMENELSGILTMAYEVEGLLLVIDKHGASAPPAVLAALRDKSRRLADSIALLQLPAPAPEPAPEPATEPATPSRAAAPIAPPAAAPAPDDLIVDDQPDHSADEDDMHELFGAGGYIEPAKREPAPARREPADQPMRVDEKLQRTLSRDLRRAFSLNDRFRFRRELFHGNDALMDDALRRVEGMSAYAEAEHYFVNDLGWDADNPDAADFLTIIRNHLEG